MCRIRWKRPRRHSPEGFERRVGTSVPIRGLLAQQCLQHDNESGSQERRGVIQRGIVVKNGLQGLVD